MKVDMIGNMVAMAMEIVKKTVCLSTKSGSSYNCKRIQAKFMKVDMIGNMVAMAMETVKKTVCL